MECPFDLTNKKAVHKFEEVDPYNPQNKVKGYINCRQGQLYGSLYITHINDKECHQVIFSAPKQHYPFDNNMKWEFPEYDALEIFEKLDGTCIVSYMYRDSDGKLYLTFKTRLRPFLGSGKYGNFKLLWDEMLDKYNIMSICRDTSYNFVFELYGKRNKILIDYDVPLDTRCLFIIDTISGGIIPANPFLAPLPYLRGIRVKYENLQDGYIKMQDELEKALVIDEASQIMKGKEGTVWYFLKDGYAKQIKCKPPSVLKYHWSGDAIPYESIYTTIYNAFENFDEPTYDNIVSLLLEEFEQGKIDKSRVRIEKLMGKVLFDKKLQFQLAEDYRREGFNINKDKATCMRWFGLHYPKSEAKRIFNLLKAYEEKK